MQKSRSLYAIICVWKLEYEKLSGVEKEDENVDENKDDKKKKQR